jgi:diphosphomevalonate decarboxylase
VIVEASAPANIALIKYMGKLDSSSNKPTNSSLSWTLDELRTYVKITLVEDQSSDTWQPLQGATFEKMDLSEEAKQRYLKHFAFLKSEWGMKKNFVIESANNFPSDCGLASSASSFAALTKAAVEMFQELAPREDIGIAESAELSRKGSGSSCRSFFGPWALWYADGVRPLEFALSNLSHQVIVVEDKKKEVSSSEAHLRVVTSPLFNGRVARAEQRLAELLHALKQEDWNAIHQICLDEFLDMHALFESSSQPFHYIQSSTKQVLKYAEDLWKENSDGPVVTMDAGANVHFLWRADQLKMAKKTEQDLAPQYRLFSSRKISEGTQDAR